MVRTSLVSIAVLLAIAAGPAWADADAKKDGACCAASEKIAKLLASWKSATEEVKAGCPEEKTRLDAQFASTAKECPVGCRMAETLGFVRSALAVALAADEAAAKDCPLSRAGQGADGKSEAKEPAAKTGGGKSEVNEAAASTACCEAGKLKAARSKLLADLHQLVTYATGVAPAACAKEGAALASAKAGSACCAKEGAAAAATGASNVTATAAKAGLCEKRAGDIVAAVRKESCEKGAAAILMKEIEGLQCEQKAGEILAAIRAESCDKGAAQILIKAASGLQPAAATKEGAVLASAKAGSACCAKEGAANATAAKGSEACCGGSGGCCKDLGAKAVALKASWDKAPLELASMCPQKRKELTASLGSLCQRSKVIALLPETVLALADGVDALESVNAGMVEWAKANPAVLATLPDEAKRKFECTNSLIHEAGEILRRVRAAVRASNGEHGEKKTETASN